jgi:hypothetical protein
MLSVVTIGREKKVYNINTILILGVAANGTIKKVFRQ